MNHERYGRTLASLAHAVLVGGAGAGAYLLAKGEGPLWVGAAVFIVARVAGAAINVFLPPRRWRHRPLPGPKQLDGMQEDFHERVSRAIDLVAWLQSEVDYLVSEIRHGVDAMNREK